MELVTPAIGLVFWTTLAFIILLALLSKFAWKPMLGAVKEREESIANALKSADKAREEMAALQADNELLLKKAREERDTMLREARDAKDQIIAEAKGQAKEEAGRIIANAKLSIENEKNAAMAEIKTMAAEISLQMAGMILKENLVSDDKQKALADKYLQEIKLN